MSHGRGAVRGRTTISPACAPRWREVARPRLGVSLPERLTPDRICGSAWWVKDAEQP